MEVPGRVACILSPTSRTQEAVMRFEQIVPSENLSLKLDQRLTRRIPRVSDSPSIGHIPTRHKAVSEGVV